jgi:hypothetical protein
MSGKAVGAARGAGSLLLEVLALVCLPLLMFGILVWAGMDETVATVIYLFVVIPWLAWDIWRLVRWLKRKHYMRGSGTVKVFTISALFLIALTSPAAAKATEWGGYEAGPIRPNPVFFPDWFTYHPSDEAPPVGCRTFHVWSTGQWPVFALKTTYRFHMQVDACWTASAWVSGQENQASGRRIKSWKIQTWWSDPSDTVHIGGIISKRTVLYGCRDSVMYNYSPRGCLFVKRTAQVDWHVIPGIGFPGGSAHPWVALRIGPDGYSQTQKAHDLDVG